MELYNQLSFDIARVTMRRYSTSFSRSTALFPLHIRRHIYAIYGLVRVADEIVDSYHGSAAATLLDELEKDVYRSITIGYSTNPIVHAFALTSRHFGITKDLIEPFFTSMRMDLTVRHYTKKQYEAYIYGSAEVIGLMCLSIFCEDDSKKYTMLSNSARHLGAAYQKINFLRDLAADNNDLGRFYFPGYTISTFNEAAKNDIIRECQADLVIASRGIADLPQHARQAVQLSSRYYTALLEKLQKTSVEVIKIKRVRLNSAHKLWASVAPSRKNIL
jgi:phytoene synthase